MIIWICNKCGCELKQEDKPKECPLCRRSNVEFEKFEKKDSDTNDKYTKKYEEVIEKLEAYTKDCPSMDLKHNCAE